MAKKRLSCHAWHDTTGCTAGDILLSYLCYTKLKLRILLQVSITYAPVLYLEGGCGFLAGYSLALSQVLARPLTSYCCDCRAGGGNPGMTCLQCLEMHA